MYFQTCLFLGNTAPVSTNYAVIEDDLLIDLDHEDKPVLALEESQQLVAANDWLQQQEQLASADDWQLQAAADVWQQHPMTAEEFQKQQLPSKNDAEIIRLEERLAQALEQLGQLEEERSCFEQRLEQLGQLEEERNSLEQRLEQTLEDKCELEELENDSRLREEIFLGCPPVLLCSTVSSFTSPPCSES